LSKSREPNPERLGSVDTVTSSLSVYDKFVLDPFDLEASACKLLTANTTRLIRPSDVVFRVTHLVVLREVLLRANLCPDVQIE
jgi:hypothetical protein